MPDLRRVARRVDPVAAGLVLGYLADRLVGDPRRGHPVAGFGQAALRVEQFTYAPRRSRGVLHEALLVGPVVLIGLAASRWRSFPAVASTATATWVVLGGRSLEREAREVHRRLEGGDLGGARERVSWIVGRDPSQLSADEVARACIESVAENTADAVVAPLFWGAVAGIPGLLGYRAINTLDAMVGHRSERYREFGWAAARLDDLANAIPARLTVLATMMARPRAVASILHAVREDAPAHPSPNAGPVEAAAAAALGVRLGGANTYDGVSEDRGYLGDGPAPTASDIPRAVSLVRASGVISLGIAVAARSLVRTAIARR
ncbi:cobalamin biosynthesis protein [Janibacter sp. GXQ6167]|uniref:cobalamin biosynthesis protein n=1 Tax=Janibacter sp. GXQ6167 TaxID=3240791 RepID=UPI0035240C4F